MPISALNRIISRWLLGVALLTVTWLTLTPNPVPMPDMVLADKWSHLLAFLLLAFLTDLSWPARPFGRAEGSALIGYGVLLEVVQSQIPQRMFDSLDIVANAIGVGLYVWGLARLMRIHATDKPEKA